MNNEHKFIALAAMLIFATQSFAKIDEYREKNCNSLYLSGIDALTSIPVEVLGLPSVTELRMSGSGITDLSLLAKLPGLRGARYLQHPGHRPGPHRQPARPQPAGPRDHRNH